MKILTPNLARFAVATSLATLLFRISLSYSITSKVNLLIIFVSLLYTLSMTFIGWYFGKRDRAYLPFYDVGFRFHLATYLTHNLVSELWFISGLQSRYENIRVVHTTAIIWGVFLLIHFILFLSTRNKTINNLNKEDLFE